METKTYTSTEKSWLRVGLKIGGEFGDHGKRMRVVRIGEPYQREGEKDRVIDVEAVEVQDCRTKSKRKI